MQKKDISDTLLARDYKDPKCVIVKEATKKGYKKAYPGDSINLEHPNSETRRGRVGVGVANCLTTSCNQAIVEPNELIQSHNLNHYGNDQMNRVYSPEWISPTIVVVSGGGREQKIIDEYRIRKLIPYECLRLMGLSHEEAMILINSGISNSQLYKLAGNSIVKQCMRFLKKLGAIYILNEDKPQGQLSLF